MYYLAFLLPISLLLGTNSFSFLPIPIYAAHVVMLSIVVVGLWRVTKKEMATTWGQFSPLLQIALVGILLSISLGGLRAESIREGVAAAVSWGVLPALTVFSFSRYAQRNPKTRLKDGLIQGLGCFAIFQTVWGLILLLTNDTNVEQRLLGTFASPNGYAAAVVPIFALYLYKAVTEKRISLYVLVAILLLGLILSKSLGGMLAACAVMLVVGYKILQNRYKFVAVIGVSLLVLFGAGIAFERFNNREGNSFASRMQIWNSAQALIVENPMLGVGLRSFESAYQNKVKELYPNPFQVIEYDVPEPHNLYLAWWLGAGLLGLLSFLLLHGILFFKEKIAIGVLLPLLAVLVHGLVDTPFFLLELAILWWMYIAIVLQVRNE